jgi:hypothetical protein
MSSIAERDPTTCMARPIEQRSCACHVLRSDRGGSKAA